MNHLHQWILECAIQDTLAKVGVGGPESRQVGIRVELLLWDDLFDSFVTARYLFFPTSAVTSAIKVNLRIGTRGFQTSKAQEKSVSWERPEGPRKYRGWHSNLGQGWWCLH